MASCGPPKNVCTVFLKRIVSIWTLRVWNTHTHTACHKAAWFRWVQKHCSLASITPLYLLVLIVPVGVSVYQTVTQSQIWFIMAELLLFFINIWRLSVNSRCPSCLWVFWALWCFSLSHTHTHNTPGRVHKIKQWMWFGMGLNTWRLWLDLIYGPCSSLGLCVCVFLFRSSSSIPCSELTQLPRAQKLETLSNPEERVVCSIHQWFYTNSWI